MSTTSKSIFSFLAGAATVVAAGAFLSSKNGKKVTRTVADRLQNIKRHTEDGLDSDWINELSDSAIHSAKNFRNKMKL
ncbi:hypothetical protein QYS49_13215 [Marivirga salinae]|uniref:YtxH domain-containing protein n=1 Tax=Marivirga salinarum TaxID=3059078 RepID=A0AA49JC61_9BACT|nr:hypothetical protein [Marivirga sp. BDSF4-3]WKK77940.2 hypothetical protein QYS49_13215 [Marivirga sp. BDSF4-3]